MADGSGLDLRRGPAGEGGAAAGGCDIRLGMPHLSGTGLSETWLLKDCGHRHWQMLAAAAGRTVPDFRTPAGAPIYAAFTGVTVEASAFADCREHDRIAIRARLVRISRTRVFSDHRLTRDGVAIGRVGLTSTFVHRTRPGANRSAARIEVPGLAPPMPDGEAAAHDAIVAAAGSAADAGEAGAAVEFLPCPAVDFNGAGFLYFAAFIAFAERAEWAASGSDALRPLASRAVRFFGNVEVGEAIRVAVRPTAAGRRTTIRSARDGRLLAALAVERRQPR